MCLKCNLEKLKLPKPHLNKHHHTYQNDCRLCLNKKKNKKGNYIKHKPKKWITVKKIKVLKDLSVEYFLCDSQGILLNKAYFDLILSNYVNKGIKTKISTVRMKLNDFINYNHLKNA